MKSRKCYNVNIMVVAMHNPRRLLLFGCVLKPKAVEARFKQVIGTFFQLTYFGQK